jgi:hypothetical protein
MQFAFQTGKSTASVFIAVEVAFDNTGFDNIRDAASECRIVSANQGEKLIMIRSTSGYIQRDVQSPLL